MHRRAVARYGSEVPLSRNAHHIDQMEEEEEENFGLSGSWKWLEECEKLMEGDRTFRER
jgi:hypothetical protein